MLPPDTHKEADSTLETKCLPTGSGTCHDSSPYWHVDDNSNKVVYIHTEESTVYYALGCSKAVFEYMEDNASKTTCKFLPESPG